jgi:hypothetical protein
MAPGCWYRISGDRPDLDFPPTPPGTRYLEDGDPARDPRLNPPRGFEARLRRAAGRYVKAPWSGRCDFRSITECWNGAVFASRFGTSGSMIVFGGGHDDYFGSDVHAFDLESREWRRLTDGYVTGGPRDYGAGAVYDTAVYPDGSPLPPHTYGYVQYDPVGNDYLLLKGQRELGPNVGPTPIPHMFNLDTLTWRHGPKHPEANLASAGWSAWDPKRRILWGNGGSDSNAFIGYSPDKENADGTVGRWTEMHPNKIPAEADHNAMTFDPIRDMLVVAVSASNALYAIDPADPAKPIAPLNSSGERPTIEPYCALEYAPTLSTLVSYAAPNGAALFAVEPPEGGGWPALTSGKWIWRSLLGADDTLDPIADAAGSSGHRVSRGQTFGRFRVATFGSSDIAILIRHIDSPVYAMRLT